MWAAGWRSPWCCRLRCSVLSRCEQPRSGRGGGCRACGRRASRCASRPRARRALSRPSSTGCTSDSQSRSVRSATSPRLPAFAQASADRLACIVPGDGHSRTAVWARKPLKCWLAGTKMCAAPAKHASYSYARCARRLRATRDNSTWPATCISVTAPRVRLVALQNMFGGRNPLVPLGCLATAGVLCRGVLAMYQGDKILSQKMMRGRACTRAAYCCCALPSVCGACSRTSKTRVAVAVHAGPCLTRCDGRLCCAHRHPGARSDCHHDRGRRDCRAHPISAKTTDGGRGNTSGSRTGDGCGTGAEIDRVTSAARLCVGWRVHATEESRKSEHCLVRRS